jgi:hypothetical protein
MDGIAEVTAVGESISASRQEQDQHWRALFFSTRAERWARGNLVRGLPHTTSHSAALTVFRAAAAPLLGRLGLRRT